MTLIADIVTGAKFRADLVNSDRVSAAEWRDLVKEAIQSAWTLAASARPDFQVTFADFVVASSNAASFEVPARFHSEVDVVYSPDTSAEYSLGTFAWQNRRAPGGWMPWAPVMGSGGANRARLMGSTVYLEPAQRAAGTYRLWYVPKPKTPDYTVRVSGGLTANTPAGSGISKTLTANANGALSVDGVAMVVGDRVLVAFEASTVNNGIYTVSNAGSAGTPWVLVRAGDWNESAEVVVGSQIFVSEGTTMAGFYWELTVFGGTIDVSGQTFALATIDPILEPFAELLKVSAAITPIFRDDDLDPKPMLGERQRLEGQLADYFRRNRSGGMPEKTIDTDARGPYAAGGGW